MRVISISNPKSKSSPAQDPKSTQTQVVDSGSVLSSLLSLRTLALIVALTGMTSVLHSNLAHAEDFDAGVENEAVMADSEGAIAEAEEQKKREQADRDRNARAQQEASAEAARAKKTEADAKVQISKSMAEEARLKKEKAAADVRRQAATDRIKQTETELQARQTQLDVMRDMTNKTVADRDALEAKVKANEDRLRQLDFQIANEVQRKKDSEMLLNQSKNRMAKSQGKVREASQKLTALQKNREPSSVGGATPVSAAGAARQEGWVKLKRDCGVNESADLASTRTQSLKAGDRIYGRKHDNTWIEVQDKAAGTTKGYLAINCVK